MGFNLPTNVQLIRYVSYCWGMNNCLERSQLEHVWRGNCGLTAGEGPHRSQRAVCSIPLQAGWRKWMELILTSADCLYPLVPSWKCVWRWPLRRKELLLLWWFSVAGRSTEEKHRLIIMERSHWRRHRSSVCSFSCGDQMTQLKWNESASADSHCFPLK